MHHSKPEKKRQKESFGAELKIVVEKKIKITISYRGGNAENAPDLV